MAVRESAIEHIIRNATLAPSGDNAQPWRFKVSGDRIQLLNVPEADTSPFNHNQASNYLALGSALENMRLTAAEEGYVADIAYFPGTDEHIVAEVTLSETAPSQSSLASAISQRASNRRAYENTPLSAEELAALRSCVQEGDAVLSFVTESARVRAIGALMSAGERVTLENEAIHRFLFQHVTWNPADDALRHGFYIKTFEFKPPQEAAFRLFSNWRILRLFHPLGITRMIARDMAKIYGSSAAFGAVSLPAPTPEALLRAGMLIERVWLTATQLGLGFQVTASIPLLSVALAQGGGAELSEDQATLVQERAAELKGEFSIPNEDALVFAFRIGHAQPPSARTSRAEPRVERA